MTVKEEAERIIDRIDIKYYDPLDYLELLDELKEQAKRVIVLVDALEHISKGVCEDDFRGMPGTALQALKDAGKA